MATEILVMKPLHDDDNPAFVLVVKPWDDLGIEPLVDRAPARGVMHAGGRDVLLALEREFGLEARDFRYSAAMLREYGNLSSAFIYFAFEAALADEAPPGWWWLSSFGAGFSCHGALLQVSK